MRQVMVRYKLKAERVAENEQFIAEVFEQLKRETPADLHYATFKLDDGVSFIHIASYEEVAGGPNPLTDLNAFKAFTANIRDRCEEVPVSTPLHEVGSYEFFGSAFGKIGQGSKASR